MTDTPAESAEAPRTPEAIARHTGAAVFLRVMRFRNDGGELRSSEIDGPILEAIRAALAARDAEVLAKLEGWRRDHRYEGPFNPEDIYEELRALLSEGKPDGE